MYTEEQGFKCDICVKQFSQKCYMKKHEVTHTGGKVFKCDECGK